MESLWRIEMLGVLRAVSHDREVTRFSTQKTACLLAYLAFHLDRAHPREVLIEILWPESDPDRSRHSLSQALTSLRRQLEPPGTRRGSVLCSDRFSVRLNPAAVTTDVEHYQALLRKAEHPPSGADRRCILEQAVDLYRGELLPGFYESWVVREQDLLFQSYTGAVLELVTILESAGEGQQAAQQIEKALLLYPHCQELQGCLGRLTAAIGAPASTQRARPPKPARMQAETAPSPSAATAIPTALRGNLPPPLTRFFGRDGEMQRLRDLLQDPSVRLVTLTGPGGSGKTRLALEVAREVTESFSGAVWFVSLASLSDPALILDAVLGALDLPRLVDVSPLDQIAMVLSGERVLLVLDNFEQLVDGGAEVARQVLLRLPSLSLLVTSRRALSVSGEHVFPVLPLPVPVDESSPASLVTVPSVQLFLDRAQCVRPDFQVTEGNGQAISAIVSRLEGIPLALELAAARSTMTPPSRMLFELSHRFDVLVSRYRDAEPRHQTMSAAIDWSYRLLSSEQQRFLRRLSVFRGGWTVEAAEVVCEEPRVTECLEELREASLVLMDETDQGVRFWMLETLREYGDEELSDEERLSVRGRHRDYYLQVAEEAAPELPGALRSEWLARLEAEKGNFREALAFSREDPNGTEARLAMVGCLAPFWSWSGYDREGLEEVNAALAASDPSETTRGRALALLGSAWLGAEVSDSQADARTAMLAEAVATLRKTGPAWATVWALLRLAAALFVAGGKERVDQLSQEALELCRQHHLSSIEPWLLLGWWEDTWHLYTQNKAEALKVARWTGNKAAEASALSSLIWQKIAESDLEGARTLMEEAITICRGLRERQMLVGALHNYSQVLRPLGDYDKAWAAVEEGLAMARSMGSARLAFPLLEEIGNVAREQGDFATARRYYEEALAMEPSIGHVEDGILLHDLGRTMAAQGDLSGGRALLWKAVDLYRWPDPRSSQVRWWKGHSLLVLGYIALWEGNLEEAERLLTEGLHLWIQSSAESNMPLYLEAFGWLAAAEQDLERSARLCGAAEQLRAVCHCPQAPEDRPSHEAALTASRGALGDERFEAAWEQGRAMSLEASIALALGDSVDAVRTARTHRS